jgi:hypothetical protein
MARDDLSSSIVVIMPSALDIPWSHYPTLNFLHGLNGQNAGAFKAWLDSLQGPVEPRIAWYPSAGQDFRPLLYLVESYERTRRPAALVPGSSMPSAPDLFLFTDQVGVNWTLPYHFKPHEDDRTRMTLAQVEVLSPALYGTDPVHFLSIKVSSDKLGEFIQPVLYVQCQNAPFCAHVLLRNHVRCSHVVHVRYGGDTGSWGAWLPNVLRRLHAEVYLSDDHRYWTDGDDDLVQRFPALGPRHKGDQQELPLPDGLLLTKVREVHKPNWGVNPVKWYLVGH